MRKAVRKMGHVDMLIASITLANRATLVTRNTRHFQSVPGLRVVNWVDDRVAVAKHQAACTLPGCCGRRCAVLATDGTTADREY